MAKPQKQGRTIPRGTPRELPDEGSHNARCVGVIDVGTQKSNNPEWSDAHLVYLLFEIIGQEDSQGRPFVVSKSFNYVLTPKSNLYKALDAWGVDVEQEFVDLEVECDDREAIITIKHNEGKNNKGVFANITTITKPPKGTRIGKATVPSTILFLDDTFDEDVYNELPEFYKLKIAASEEGMEVLGLNKKAGKAKGKQRDEEEEEEEDERPARGKAKPAPTKGKSRR